jgi:hypothetical protein
MKKILLYLAFLFFVFAGGAYAESDEDLAKRISGEAYAGGAYTAVFYDHGEEGFFEVVTHGDKKIINVLSYQVRKGEILIEGDVSYYYEEMGIVTEHIFMKFVYSHDGRLYPVDRDNLVFERKD